MSLIHRRESQSSPDDYCFLAVIHFLHKKLLTTWFDLLMFQNQRKPLCCLLHRSVTKTHEQVEGLVLSDFLAVLFMEVFGFQLCRVTLPSALCGMAACSHFLFLLSFSIFVSLPYSFHFNQHVFGKEMLDMGRRLQKNIDCTNLIGCSVILCSSFN